MFERFTEKAIKVIMLSQEEARRLGHNFVGTEQILLGLIGEGTGIAARVLKERNVALRPCREEVEKIIGRGSGFVAVEIPFTPRAKRVLELSWDEARQLGHNYIGTEHLLLGLIREGEGVAARVLENLNVDLTTIRSQIVHKLGEMANPTEEGFILGANKTVSNEQISWSNDGKCMVIASRTRVDSTPASQETVTIRIPLDLFAKMVQLPEGSEILTEPANLVQETIVRWVRPRK